MVNMTLEQMKEQLERITFNIKACGERIAKYTEKGKYSDALDEAKYLKELVAEHKNLEKEIKATEKANKEVAKTEKQVEVNFVETVQRFEVVEEFLLHMFEEDLKWHERMHDMYRTNYKEWSKLDLNKTSRELSRNNREWAEKVFRKDLEIRRMKLLTQIKDNVGSVIEVMKLVRNENLGLDGWVSGDKGKIYIQTIVAGGYNIQRAHYRTLIK